MNLRVALRSLVQRPLWTALCALSLGLGIGANVTVFTLVKALFLQSVPVEAPQRVVRLFTSDEQNPDRTLPSSYPNLVDLGEQTTTLTGPAPFTFTVVSLELPDAAADLRVVAVAAGGSYFDVLGVPARRGRTLQPTDAPAPEQGEAVVVLGHGFWERHFGGEPDAVGATITLNGQPFTVVGVMPPGFAGHQTQLAIDLWIPLTLLQRVQPGWIPEGDGFTSRRFAGLDAVGRLRPGIAHDVAQAELTSLGRNLEAEYPVDNKGRNFRLVSLEEANLSPDPEERARIALAATLLMSLVGLVLLIACANVANLLLVQASRRGREIAIRSALGSTRAQLARTFLSESFLLAGLGGLLSAVLAPVGRRILVASFPAGLVQIGYDFSFDLWVIAFTAGATLFTAAIFGAIPAWRAARTDVVGELKTAASTGTRRGRRLSLGDGLVIGQMGLALVALVATGLFVRSLGALRHADPGFAASRIAAVAFDPTLAGYDDDRSETFLRRLVEGAEALPGVESAAVADFMPFRGGGFGRTVFLEGEDQGSGRGGRFVFCAGVGPGFLETLGLELLRGRRIDATDRHDSPKVVVVNEAMARQFWGDEDPIGQRFHFHGLEEPRQVVGVVADIRFFALNEEPLPAAFVPLAQTNAATIHLAVRSAGNPVETLGGIRGLFEELDPNLGWNQLGPLADEIERSFFVQRTIARLLGVFGALALILALIGLFGTVSYSVAQRRREIGIRMAIGARRADVLRQVLREGLTLVAVGMGGGLLVAWSAGRLFEGFLYGVRPTDPVTLTFVPALLLAVATLAILVPARRAASIDPWTALKND